MIFAEFLSTNIQISHIPNQLIKNRSNIIPPKDVLRVKEMVTDDHNRRSKKHTLAHLHTAYPSSSFRHIKQHLCYDNLTNEVLFSW